MSKSIFRTRYRILEVLNGKFEIQSRVWFWFWTDIYYTIQFDTLEEARNQIHSLSNVRKVIEVVI